MENSIRKNILLLLFLFACTPAMASHIVGGEMTYSYQGDILIGSTTYHKYVVTLNLYQDCLNGQPAAIAQDNPAIFAVYDGSNRLIIMGIHPFTSRQACPFPQFTHHLVGPLQILR